MAFSKGGGNPGAVVWWVRFLLVRHRAAADTWVAGIMHISWLRSTSPVSLTYSGRGYYASAGSFDVGCVVDLLWPPLAYSFHRVNSLAAVFLAYVEAVLYRHSTEGPTSCRARIRDMDGNLLGEGKGGPANIHSNFRLAMELIGWHARRLYVLRASTSKACNIRMRDWAWQVRALRTPATACFQKKCRLHPRCWRPTPMSRGLEPIKAEMEPSSFWAPAPVV